jgi:hypothetical protein
MGKYKLLKAAYATVCAENTKLSAENVRLSSELLKLEKQSDPEPVFRTEDQTFLYYGDEYHCARFGRAGWSVIRRIFTLQPEASFMLYPDEFKAFAKLENADNWVKNKNSEIILTIDSEDGSVLYEDDTYCYAEWVSNKWVVRSDVNSTPLKLSRVDSVITCPNDFKAFAKIAAAQMWANERNEKYAYHSLDGVHVYEGDTAFLVHDLETGSVYVGPFRVIRETPIGTRTYSKVFSSLESAKTYVSNFNK